MITWAVITIKNNRYKYFKQKLQFTYLIGELQDKKSGTAKFTSYMSKIQ